MKVLKKTGDFLAAMVPDEKMRHSLSRNLMTTGYDFTPYLLANTGFVSLIKLFQKLFFQILISQPFFFF